MILLVRLPRGRGFIARVLHAQKPNWVGAFAFVGGGIAVEEIAICLIEMAFMVLCGGQESGRLTLG